MCATLCARFKPAQDFPALFHVRCSFPPLYSPSISFSVAMWKCLPPESSILNPRSESGYGPKVVKVLPDMHSGSVQCMCMSSASTRGGVEGRGGEAGDGKGMGERKLFTGSFDTTVGHWLQADKDSTKVILAISFRLYPRDAPHDAHLLAAVSCLPHSFAWDCTPPQRNSICRLVTGWQVGG